MSEQYTNNKGLHLASIESASGLARFVSLQRERVCV